MDYSQEQFLKMQKTLNQGGAYPRYPQDYYMSELGYQRDYERMKQMYPEQVRKLQYIVEDECDQLEYAGSFMLDLSPDRLLLRRLCDRIYQRMENPAPEYRDLIQVMLYQEMYQRRCRYRRCTGW